MTMCWFGVSGAHGRMGTNRREESGTMEQMLVGVKKSANCGRPKGPTRRATVYCQGILAGKTKYQAALDAGYSRSVARKPGAKIERQLSASLAAAIHAAISPERVAQVLAAGLEATETRLGFANGQVVYSEPLPAHKERRESAKLAAQLGGMVTDGVMADNTIRVTIELIGS